MKYTRFEELPVWNTSIDLADKIFNLLEQSDFKCPTGLRDQLARACLSISNNIAEGFERGTTNELIHYIYIARGSAGETRSMLCLLERRAGLQKFRSEISDLKLKAENCSRQLRGWADSLQNTDIKGSRHLNDSSRREFEQRRKAQAFQNKLRQSLPANHPLRKEQGAD